MLDLGAFLAEHAEVPKLHLLDVGAYPVGEAEPWQRLVRSGQARVTAFEPIREAAELVDRRAGPLDVCLRAALGDGTRRPFHVCAMACSSSLLEPDAELCDRFQGLDKALKLERTLQLETVRLDDVEGLGTVDFIKLDTQGSELMILENGRRVLEDCLVLETELEFVPLYKGQPLFGDIDVFLRAEGFAFHTIPSVATRTYKPVVWNNDPDTGMRQWIWGDAVYVRDPQRLEAFGDDQLLKAAVLCPELYQSADLARYFLDEWDRRQGSAIGPDYLAALMDQAA